MYPGLSALKRADCKSPEKESYDFDRPFHLHFLHCNVKGPPLLRILVRGQKDGRSERRQSGEGEAVPLQKGSSLAPILVHSAEKAESLPPIGGRDWTKIGDLEGWLRHPNSGGG